MACPGGAPRPTAALGRRPVFLFFGRECRILVRAHGSVAPGSSCPGGDSHSSPGRSRSGSLQSLSQLRRPLPDSVPLALFPAVRRGSVGQLFQSRIGGLSPCIRCETAEPIATLNQNLRPGPIRLVIAALRTPSPPSARGALAPPGAATLAPSLGATNNSAFVMSFPL
jgi:hypothetical protein